MAFKRIDLTVEKFGKLTVIGLNDTLTAKSSGTYWNCSCECGNITVATTAHLRAGQKLSCGCMRKNDLTGKRFGRLFVERLANEPYITKSGKQYRNKVYICKCDCGNVVKCLGSNLTKGVTTSCGCYQKEVTSCRFSIHNMRQTRLYNVWSNMKSRCLNPKNKRFSSYGGRGICICKEWIDSFSTFSKWAMENGYSENLTIDRINVDGDYEPLNCRWVTKDVQSNNQRKTIRIEILGEIRSLKQWTNLMGWKYGTYSARYRKGKTPFSQKEIELIEQKLKE